MLVPSIFFFYHSVFFFTLSGREIIILVTFNLSSANALNLVTSEILLFGTGLTHYHTMPHFDALKIYSCGKMCEKWRICLEQAISPFFTMFSNLHGTYLSFYMYFNRSSAICFNLDQSKILSSANG